MLTRGSSNLLFLVLVLVRVLALGRDSYRNAATTRMEGRGWTDGDGWTGMDGRGWTDGDDGRGRRTEGEDEDEGEDDAGGADVVTLDNFRKK